jgi:hypothetical protein
VELKDDLTVSLLQARLIELNLPINVAVEMVQRVTNNGIGASSARHFSN